MNTKHLARLTCTALTSLVAVPALAQSAPAPQAPVAAVTPTEPSPAPVDPEASPADVTTTGDSTATPLDGAPPEMVDTPPDEPPVATPTLVEPMSLVEPTEVEVPQLPYIRRYVPENLMFELGLFGGVMFPAKGHQLYDNALPSSDRQPYKAAGDLGVRFGFYPLSFLGFEAEAALMPTALEDDTPAGLWAVRGQGVLQVPGMSVTPFLVVGGGGIGTSSNEMGNDVDRAFHFGLGVKAALDEYVMLRLDVRDTLTAGDTASTVHSPEVLIGISFVPKRSKPDYDKDGVLDYRDRCPTVAGPNNGCPPPDSDADGVTDDIDECKDLAGVAPTGCPDQDQDTLLDREDQCPLAAGVKPSGCPTAPPPVPDSDGDGVLDDADACPTEAAPTVNGCATHDQDSDGIVDEQDKCPADPETKNEFEDSDGCPDLPADPATGTAPATGAAPSTGAAVTKPSTIAPKKQP